MSSERQLEFVSVLIPRTLDQRILLTEFESRGLWLPTCRRNIPVMQYYYNTGIPVSYVVTKVN
jgi:hypothetical protein